MEEAGSGGSSQSRGRADTSQGMDILEQEICWVEDLQLTISEQKPPTFAWMGSASDAKHEIPSTPRNASYQDTEYLISTGGLRRIRIQTPSAEKSSDRDVVRADLFGNQDKIEKLLKEISHLQEVNQNLHQENHELKQDAENFADLFKNYLEELLGEAEKKHQLQLNALKVSYEKELDDLRAENTEFLKRIHSLEMALSQRLIWSKPLLSAPRDVEPEIIVSPRPQNDEEAQMTEGKKEQEEFYFSGPVEDFHLLLRADDQADSTTSPQAKNHRIENLPSTSQRPIPVSESRITRDSNSLLARGWSTNNLLTKILTARSGKVNTPVRSKSPAKLNHTNKSTRAISNRQQAASELSRFDESCTSGFPMPKSFLKGSSRPNPESASQAVLKPHESQTKSPLPSKSKHQTPKIPLLPLQSSTFDQRYSKGETPNPKHLRSKSRPKSPLTVHKLLHKTATVDTSGWPLQLVSTGLSTHKKSRKIPKA